MNTVLIYGNGGTGKTSLVRHFLNDLADEGYPGVDAVYAWSAYSQDLNVKLVSSDAFISTALSFFSDDERQGPIANSAARANELVDAIRKRRVLLILDGIERLQWPPDVNEGRLRDLSLSLLVTALASENPGLVVITSRQEVRELSSVNDTRVINHTLDPLSLSSGIALLEQLGVHGEQEELASAVQAVGRNALAVSLLGAYLSSMFAGDVTKRDTLGLSTSSGEMPRALVSERLYRIIECYLANLSKPTVEEGGSVELMVLRLVGLFEGRAPSDAVNAILAPPPISGLTDTWHKISKPQRGRRWAFALRRLRALQLLCPLEIDKKGEIEAPGAVRDYFAEVLRLKEPDAFQEAHRRLQDFYGAQRAP